MRGPTGQQHSAHFSEVIISLIISSHGAEEVPGCTGSLDQIKSVSSVFCLSSLSVLLASRMEVELLQPTRKA